MSIYIIVAILASLFAQIASMSYDKNKFLFIISFSLFVLLPSVIEGCRDWNIGEDMLSYGSYAFYNSLGYNNLFDYLRNYPTKEPGFITICFFCGKIGPINFYMFVVAFIKMMLLGLTCIQFRKNTIIWLAVLGYMLIFYWYGFSMMRQSLALSICLYSATFLYRKKYISYVVCVLISYLFHNSSVFSILLPLLLYISRFKNRLSLVVAATLIVYLSASVLFVSIATSGLFGEEMLDRYEDSGTDSPKTLLLLTAVFLISSLYYKSIYKTTKFFVQANSIIILMLLFLSSYFAASFRVAFYFIMPMLFLITCFMKSMEKQTGKLVTSICLVLVYFIHIFIAASHGLAGTYPYKSIILNSIF